MRSSFIMRRHAVSILAIVIMALSATTVQLDAGAWIEDKHIRKRIALMNTQKAAITILGDMMAGRSVFDASQAKAARRTLVKTTGHITKRFRKPRLEANSNARPDIWQYWDDFEIRAETAELAAKQLSAGSLNALRRTLPNLMQACLGCHETYRETPNNFKTH